MSSRRPISRMLFFAVLSTTWLAQQIQAEQINWRNNLDAAKVEAGRTGKLVLLHFYTSSCGPCKKLEREVFSQPQIADAMQRDFVPVKINADQAPALANAYQIQRVPSEIVLNSQGNVLQTLHCPLEPNAYGTQLVNVAQHYRGRSANRTASAQTPINSAYAGLRIGNPATQSSAGQTPSAPQQAVPGVTENPYFTATPPPASKPVASVATPPATSPTAPTTQPARYSNRYAQAASTAPAASQTAPTVAPVTTQVPPAAAPTTPMATTSAPAVAPVLTNASPTVTNKQQTQTVAATPKIQAEVWPPKLPAGTPPLAFDGYCPVSLREAKKWVRGKASLGAIHRGQTYLFASEAQRQKFLASIAASDSYSPVFSGKDPVKLLDDQVQVAGSRKYGFEYKGAFYLFSSPETKERFARQPDRYSAGVKQAMARMQAPDTGTIRR